jgi:hypothetical protein
MNHRPDTGSSRAKIMYDTGTCSRMLHSYTDDRCNGDVLSQFTMVTVRGGVLKDAEQEAVITAATDVRQLVQAGPGCGKTFVACARVAHLLESHVAPDKILLLSFTRTAVHEMRERIAKLARSDSRASGIEIRTLDSLSWRIVSAGSESVEATYTDVIAGACRAVTSGVEAIQQYLHRFRHVFIDEAQDLVGPRARLALALLSALDGRAGYTLFVDRAQAIYGWSSEDGGTGGGEQFVQLLDGLPGPVVERRLSTVHRTDDARIRDLLARSRAIVLSGADELEKLRACASEEAADAVARWQDLGQFCHSSDGEKLVLFRRRAEALLASANLSQQSIHHRLRVGSMPRLAAPWISVVANNLARAHQPLRPSRPEFDQAWRRVSHLPLAAGWTADAAWLLLQRIAPGDRVDLSVVARRLAWGSAPDDVFKKDLGSGPLIVGTIHASKGREAEEVLVCADLDSPPPKTVERAAEEARVLYVALSRGRRALEVRGAPRFICQSEDGRAWHHAKTGIQVEIGRDGDVDPVWPMKMDGAERALAIQEQLQLFSKPVRVKVIADAQLNWSRLIRIESDDALIGSLTLDTTRELQSIAKTHLRSLKPSNFLAHLWWFDVTTYAVPEDHPALQDIPYPWNETRMWLAPVVVGVGLMPRS